MVLASTTCDAGGAGAGMGLFFAAARSLLSGALFRNILVSVKGRRCAPAYLIHGEGPAKLGCANRATGRQHGNRAALSSIGVI